MTAVSRPGRRGLVAAAKAAVWLGRIVTLLLFLVPLLLVIWTSFSADSSLTIPPSGYSLKWYANILRVPELSKSLVTSLEIAAIVTPITLLCGAMAGYGQWRHPLLPLRVMETIFSLPMLVPLVITGLALLNLFSAWGFYSGFWNIVIAHLVMTFPFVLRFVVTALSRYDHGLDEAAMSLGARPWRVVRHVVLPVLRPALFAGGLFSFVISFDDFGVAIFLVDSRTVTLPVAMYQYMEWNIDPTLAAMSAALVGAAAVITLLCERLFGLDRFVGID